MGSGRDPSNLVERKGYVVAVNRCRLSRVYSHPDLDLDSGRPGVGGQCQLGFQTCCDRLSRIRKGDEQRVAFGPYLGASVAGHRGAEQLVVVCQQTGVRITQLTEESRRTFDVGEDEGDETRGQRFRPDRRFCRGCLRCPTHGIGGSSQVSTGGSGLVVGPLMIAPLYS